MTTPPKKRRGRPPKTALTEAKKRPVGRPKGDSSAIEEFKARILASPRSQKVLDSIMNAALDDNHKNQAAAWKLLMDRLAPLSFFEKDKLQNGRASVNITISGVGDTVEIVGEDTVEDVPFVVSEDDLT